MHVGLAVLCGLALAVLIVALIQRAGVTVSFQIVDYVTGKTIRGAHVEISRKWTRLPVEGLPFLGITPFYHRTFPAETGVATITGLRRLDQSFRIVVQAKGYADAFIQAAPDSNNPDVFCILYFGTNWLHESPYEYVNRKEPFTISLEPEIGGTERAGARYSMTPSAGSREKAILAINNYAKKRGANGTPARSTKFVNGHWEVGSLTPSLSVVGDSTFDVSEDGEILGIHPGE